VACIGAPHAGIGVSRAKKTNFTVLISIKAEPARRRHASIMARQNRDSLVPTCCPACQRPMQRIRTICRSFQDDMDVWECRMCGASVAQTVNAAKLAQQLPGSVHFN
jgi:ribosomal protein L37AE/L43A